MEITEVKVFPVSEDKLKAFVSIVLDRCFMVNDIKVIRGKDGLFISMPSRKKKNGEFKDVAHPLNNETRQRIENEVLDEYERILRERGEEPEAERRKLDVPQAEPPAPESERASETGSDAEVQPRESRPERPAAAERPREGAAEEPTEDAEEDGSRDRSLKEVEEHHLRDSFWSVS